ncbi:MAG: hypothetical protein ABI175_14250 [Polyangiales bacterium]
MLGTLALVGCGGDAGEGPADDAAVEEGGPTFDALASDSSGSDSRPTTTDTKGTDGVVASDTSPPSTDSGPVGLCDAACTGTKMCNGAGACVCAPGWTSSGTECVAIAISSPAARTKAEVCARYKADTARPAMLWQPGTGGECDPGTVPFDAQVAALRYLDFYRWMVGVGPVQVVPAVAKAEQECAKILNYEFGHSPAPTTKCYTADGAAACGASLIAGGFDLMTQFDGYGMEIDQNLIHRRNVLAVGRAGVWAGASGGSSDMHYGGAYPALSTDPEYVAHPGPGPNVRMRVPSRWFVQKGTKSIAAVDARVFVVATGEEKTMTRYHHFADFSSFDVSGWIPAVDTPYRVELIDDAKVTVTKFETTFVDCP